VSTTLAELILVMEKRYPTASAEIWDAVGLVSGHPDQKITKVLFAVDPAEQVIAEAIQAQAQLVIVHHPLILRGISSVAESTRKGRIISSLIKAELALFTIHTNADVAKPGVSDALGKALGIEINNFSALDPITGLGRLGNLAKRIPLQDFANQMHDSLPKTKRGINVAGNLQMGIERVAVCGGAGDSLLELVSNTDADVYVTSDLKYHVAEEFVQSTGKALIDISHWAGEWPWLCQAAEFLHQDLGGTLETQVSNLVTDPWSLSIN